jgi:hypothetical protein
MGRTIKWERLALLRTPVLMILGLIALTIGAFRSPWPWIGWAVLGACLVFVAYVTDTDEQEAPAG